MANVVGSFTRDDLAREAGVSAAFVDRLVDLHILTPKPIVSPFSGGDLHRVRLVHGLEQGGIPLDALASAVRSGALSFDFFDAHFWDRFGGLSEKTFRELSEETGLSLEFLQAMRESIGYARPEPEDRVRKDELEIVPLLATIAAAGVNSAVLERQIRTWGESLRRIAEADSGFYRDQIEAPLLEAGLSWSDMLQVASQASESFVPFLDPALLSAYHAQSEHTWMSVVVEAVEATLEVAGLHRIVAHPPAMCFLDLSGYTRLTEEKGDSAAAEMAAALGRLVQTGSLEHGGRPVKWLGDGVMVHFKHPADAVLFALEERDAIPAAGLPSAHVGIAAGPLVFQDGDYFGRTVNLAARIASYAGAGQVLVSDEVVDEMIGRGVEFTEIGPAALKGVAAPVRLHEACLSR